jgi:hypothetical protein
MLSCGHRFTQQNTAAVGRILFDLLLAPFQALPAEACASVTPSGSLDLGGMTPVSKGSWKALLGAAIVLLPGETESGSAGKQLDKGYLGRRCAKGASGPLAAFASRGRFRTSIGHRSHTLKNPFFYLNS